MDHAMADRVAAVAALDEPTRRRLYEHGFEPRPDGPDVLLGNCPFHTLAQGHTELVCGMNLSLLNGLLRGLGRTDTQAELDPAPGRCCMRLTPTSTRRD